MHQFKLKSVMSERLPLAEKEKVYDDDPDASKQGSAADNSRTQKRP